MKPAFDAVVIGAGPAGSRTARNLARMGFEVALIEDHKQVGEPCHCSGLVTPRTLEAAEAGPGLVLNAIRGATFHCGRMEPLQLTSRRAGALAIDRIELDRRLVNQAVEAGVHLRLGSKFVRFRIEEAGNRSGGRVSITLDEAGERVEVSADLLVGADGALSRVALQLSGLRPPRLVRALGGEAEYQGNPLAHHVQVFLDERAAPGWFGWTIPISPGKARVGTGTTNGVRPSESLSMLREAFPTHFSGSRLVHRRAGIIPVWEPAPMAHERVILVGDAARQVKPASGGGILTALVSAELAAEHAGAALLDRDLSAGRLSSYQRAWQRQIGRELKRQHDMRRALNRLDAGSVEAFLSSLGAPKLRASMERTGDIDLPSSLVWRILVRHPSVFLSAAVIPRFPLAWLRPGKTRLAEPTPAARPLPPDSRARILTGSEK